MGFSRERGYNTSDWSVGNVRKYSNKIQECETVEVRQCGENVRRDLGFIHAGSQGGLCLGSRSDSGR